MGKTQPPGLNMTPSKTRFGKFVRNTRLRLGLRQVPLSCSLGASRCFISNLELGKTKYISDERLARLASKLGCTVEELLSHSPKRREYEIRTEIGKLINTRRSELGMDIESFASKMGMPVARAKRFEFRSNPSIRYPLAKKLGEVLSLDPSSLSRFVSQDKVHTLSRLGELIRPRRKELGMSLDALGKKIGCTRAYLSILEIRDQSLSGSIDMLNKLAKVLDLDIEILKALMSKRKLKIVKSRDKLGQFLADKRLELNLTQRELALRAGFKMSVISHIELGLRHPSDETLERIRAVLNCDIPKEIIPPAIARGRRSILEKRKTGLGSFLTKRRQELCLTQKDVSARAGIKYQSKLSRIEMGDIIPDKQTLDSLSSVLNCEIPALYLE